jgi:DNA repair protein RadC
MTTYIREVQARYSDTNRETFTVDGPKVVSDFVEVVYELSDLTQEHFVALYCDTKNKVVAHTLISVGTVKEALVSPIDIFKIGLLCNAVSIIIVHNHPTGDTTPSAEDKQTTKRIKEGCDLLGFRLLDHLIVGNKKYFSFQSEGMIL